MISYERVFHKMLQILDFGTLWTGGQISEKYLDFLNLVCAGFFEFFSLVFDIAQVILVCIATNRLIRKFLKIFHSNHDFTHNTSAWLENKY